MPVQKTVQRNIPLGLMDLPGEVRNMIWTYTLGSSPPRIIEIVSRVLDPGEGNANAAATMRFIIGRQQGWDTQFSYELLEAGQLGNEFGFFGVNHQVNEEGEGIFYRPDMVFSFGPPEDPEEILTVYHGVLAAWAFFQDRRRRPAALQHIRRMHLDLTQGNFTGSEQTLVATRPQAGTDGSEFVDPLLDLIGTSLPNLQYLSLAFNGWPPETRQEPASVSRFFLVLLVLTCITSQGGAKAFLRYLAHRRRTSTTGLIVCLPYLL